MNYLQNALVIESFLRRPPIFRCLDSHSGAHSCLRSHLFQPLVVVQKVKVSLRKNCHPKMQFRFLVGEQLVQFNMDQLVHFFAFLLFSFLTVIFLTYTWQSVKLTWVTLQRFTGLALRLALTLWLFVSCFTLYDQYAPVPQASALSHVWDPRWMVAWMRDWTPVDAIFTGIGTYNTHIWTDLLGHTADDVTTTATSASWWSALQDVWDGEERDEMVRVSEEVSWESLAAKSAEWPMTADAKDDLRLVWESVATRRMTDDLEEEERHAEPGIM